AEAVCRVMELSLLTSSADGRQDALPAALTFHFFSLIPTNISPAFCSQQQRLINQCADKARLLMVRQHDSATCSLFVCSA
ncbi:hypothetical protein, partial [Candidatus Electronema sp. TJ]|uniref:hypothetical protein n=1 Tax=Candidatus Electronema sp. TJ TaxID=3401573 RepID=UPI003AA9B6FF